MATFSWNETFSVGIGSIDEQHKRLVSLVSGLFDAMSQGKGAQVLANVLTTLVEYTKTHFRYEESLMQTHGYPGLAAHKAEHDQLAAKANDLLERFKTGSTTISVQTGNFLKEWLVGHMLGADKKYSSFLQAKGVR